MKKIIITFSIIAITLLIIVCVSLMQNNKNLQNIKQYNKQYEEYYGKVVYGTDVISLINKATNENIKNNIEKDEKGNFIENDINSIKIEIKLLSEGKLTTYNMERLTKVGLEGFIKSFNLIQFKCTNINYHENTKRVKSLVFEQIQE